MHANVHFQCTECGKCCHGLKLRFTLAQARAWLRDGNGVHVLIEATPWDAEPDGATPPPPAAHPDMARKQRRTFGARSGALDCRIELLLTSAHTGACPNLGADMRCTIYARRPSICRVYPADTLGLGVFSIAGKKCPPEAWRADAPAFIQGGRLVDAEMQDAIDHLNQAAESEAEQRMRLSAALGLDRAAFVGEGYVQYVPDPAVLAAALDRVATQTPLAVQPVEPLDWTVVTNQGKTQALLQGAGAHAERVVAAVKAPYDYHAFLPAQD